ncbi:MAG TPA: inositol monophosphatase family protein [Candidatus Omnitrophota bacterium]|nr:inositol monophosphatase family protein [Candidatus Omnitrophota bacterium]
MNFETNDLSKLTDVAICAARAAGEHALTESGRIKEISTKQNFRDIVTNVDKECEAIAIDIIKKEFPDHSILAEESGGVSEQSGFLWVIDPIDGTVNFAHSFPFFCTSIGVMIDGSVKIGVVYDPIRKELFTAERGKGAELNGRLIKVSLVDDLKKSLLSTGFAYKDTDKEKNIPFFHRMLTGSQAVRRPGSAALDLCYVACGRLDGYWEFGLKPWDTAAGHLIVRESGGMVTTLSGAEFGIFLDETVATNGLLHRQMLDLLNGK